MATERPNITIHRIAAEDLQSKELGEGLALGVLRVLRESYLKIAEHTHYDPIDVKVLFNPGIDNVRAQYKRLKEMTEAGHDYLLANDGSYIDSPVVGLSKSISDARITLLEKLHLKLRGNRTIYDLYATEDAPFGTGSLLLWETLMLQKNPLDEARISIFAGIPAVRWYEDLGIKNEIKKVDPFEIGNHSEVPIILGGVTVGEVVEALEVKEPWLKTEAA